MRMGVAEYILKPLRASTFVAKIEALVHSLPRVAVEASDLESILVKPDAPALVADGNLDFRFFFNGQVSRYGPIVQAESGAAERGPASSRSSR